MPNSRFHVEIPLAVPTIIPLQLDNVQTYLVYLSFFQVIMTRVPIFFSNGAHFMVSVTSRGLSFTKHISRPTIPLKSLREHHFYIKCVHSSSCDVHKLFFYPIQICVVVKLSGIRISSEYQTGKFW